MAISTTSWHYIMFQNWYAMRNKQLPNNITLCAYCRQIGWILFLTTTVAVAQKTWQYLIVTTFKMIFELVALIFNIMKCCICLILLPLIGSYPTRRAFSGRRFNDLEVEEYWLPTVRGYRIIPFNVILVIAYIWAFIETVADFKTNGWAVLSNKYIGNSIAGTFFIVHTVALATICMFAILFLWDEYLDEKIRYKDPLKQKRQSYLQKRLTETIVLLSSYFKALKQRVCPIIVFVNDKN